MSSPAGNPQWSDIERALNALLDLPEHQQAAFLDNLPPAVRAEVESLLGAYRRSGSFLGEPSAAPADPAALLGRMRELLAAAGAPAPGITGTYHAPLTLQPGTRLGSYRIEAQLGQGGMGVVYRALDTKLNRPVAVKLLFDELADAAARRRFQREAQMASSLNHPHILTVHDTGEFEGRQYLVTEFVDGGTLKDWARAGKRTWREIVTLLVGVADGLAAAHSAGILHRDIKPDNILVGSNGYAKLSDFGLAKLQEQTAPAAVTRTMDSKNTRPGMILGTIAYMSPEQAAGRATDARSDIFSFGIVLYELLAGRRPFPGATDLETLQLIIHRDAPPLGEDVAPPLRMVVEKALEKDPADRYQSARDLVVDLRRLTRQSGEATAASGTAPAVAPAPPRRASVVWIAGGLLAVLLGAGALELWLARAPVETPAQVVQFDIAPPAGTLFAPPVSRQPFAISPDGRRLAFTATGADGTQVYIRDLASPNAWTVPGSDGAWSLFWSLDSRSIYFSVRDMLKQWNLDTNSGRSITQVQGLVETGSWRANGDMLLFFGPGDNYEVHPVDGSLRKVPGLPQMRYPQFLPDGRHFISTIYDMAAQRGNVVLADFDNPKPLTLMQTDTRVLYAPPRRHGVPGHLLFIRGASLLAQPFDADRLSVAGEAFPIAQNVVYYGATITACFSASNNGVLVYQAGFPAATMKWYDRNGNVSGDAGQPNTYWGFVRVSRDGRRVASTIWSSDNGNQAIWIYDANGQSRRLTYPPEAHRRPVWSPDGTRLAFGASPNMGVPKLAIADLAGAGTVQPFFKDGGPLHAHLPTDWSPDGRFIAFDDGIGNQAQKVSLAEVSTHKFVPLFDNRFAQWGTAFAPDVRRIAFISTESGRPEAYVQAFDASGQPRVTGERRQISRNGAWLVRWRPDGRELFYLGLDNVLYAVAVKGDLEFAAPESLFRIPGASQYGSARDFQFDVSADGKHFVMPNTGSIPPPAYTVIQNWQDKFHQ